MRPPPLRLLQAFNLLTGFGSFLTATLSNHLWCASGWTPTRIGVAMMLANLSYAAVVAGGGWLADHWGRARVAIAGSLVSAFGCALVLVAPGPWMALAASMLAFAGPALYFPGSAGLFSDAEGEAGPPPPLHAKLSRYNLGWACGNLGGFLGLGLFDPRWVGYATALAGFLVIAVAMWRWRALPPRPPAPDGDRMAHPAVPLLTLIGRCALLLGCLLGMAVIALVQKAIEQRDPADLDAVRRWASVLLTAYSSGQIAMFILLGRWSGWVLRPWRLWCLQLGFLVGGIGFTAAACTGTLAPLTLALCGIVLGSAYAAVYTSSIYYSLRSPAAAGRAAGWHETFIGVGNTLGPLAGGLWLWAWLGAWPASGQALVALGVLVVGVAVLLLLFQAVLIPVAARRGAR